MNGLPKVVLSVDALAATMGGIGRYSWELASHLPKRPELRDIRFYRAGRWIRNPATLIESPEAGATIESPKKNWSHRVPKTWRAAYWRFNFSNRLFHAPNYFLPGSVERGIATVHDLSVIKYPETHPIERVREFERLFEHTLRRSAHLITDSETVRNEVISRYAWSARKITAVPLGVSQDFAPWSQSLLNETLANYGLKPGGYTLCVATIEPRKRLDALLTAYATLSNEERLRFPLVLVGAPGWRCEEILAKIDEARSQGWVHYLKFVPELALPTLHAGAALFAYLSIDEGFGLPPIEAMASGVPVLSSNRSCLPEVTRGAALLVDPDDIDGIVAGLRRGIHDEDWRRVAVQSGLAVASTYTWESCAAQTAAVYQHCWNNF